MNIVKTGDGRFIEVQGTAEAMPFGRDALMTLLDLADHGIRAAGREAARDRRAPGEMPDRSRTSDCVPQPPDVRYASCVARSRTRDSDDAARRHAGARSDDGLCALEFTVEPTGSGCRGWTRGSRRWFPPHEIVDRRDAGRSRRRATGSTATSRARAADIGDLPLDMRGAAVRAARVGGAARHPAGRDDQLRRDRQGARRPPAPRARSAWPTAPTRSRSSCPAIASSAPTGSLTGYGGGLERKTWLIDHERRWRNEPQARCSEVRNLGERLSCAELYSSAISANSALLRVSEPSRRNSRSLRNACAAVADADFCACGLQPASGRNGG